MNNTYAPTSTHPTATDQAKPLLQRRQRVLLLHGGWRGHAPKRIADFTVRHLLAQYDVVRSDDLRLLRREVLAKFDLLIPVWTFGRINKQQESHLLDAVADGLGLVAWHGSTSAFLESRPHKFLLGGQFVGHPGGNNITYTVRFHDNDPLVAGLDPLTVTSEQYYLLVDPAVKVLASTIIDGDTMKWLKGVNMPVVWTRQWGQGRVFYSSLGHTLEILQQSSIRTMLSRAVAWACRESAGAALPR